MSLCDHTALTHEVHLATGGSNAQFFAIFSYFFSIFFLFFSLFPFLFFSIFFLFFSLIFLIFFLALLDIYVDNKMLCHPLVLNLRNFKSDKIRIN